jgi:hypothetical protein
MLPGYGLQDRKKYSGETVTKFCISSLGISNLLDTKTYKCPLTRQSHLYKIARIYLPFTIHSSLQVLTSINSFNQYKNSIR